MPCMASSDRSEDEGGEEGGIDFEGILEDLRRGKCTREEGKEEEGKEEEGWVERSDLLSDYVAGVTNKKPQHVNQEFRTALTAEAVRNFKKLRAERREKVWEAVVHQLLRSWEDVQIYCYDHHCACPDLQSLLAEAGGIPITLEQSSLLYAQAYLKSAGWRGAGEERKTAEEWEAHQDVREGLARPLVDCIEAAIVLPTPLRDSLIRWVRREGRMSPREGFLAQARQQDENDAAGHVAWLEDRYLEAQHLLVLSNMRFAVHKARKYSGKGVDVADLIQESALGLMAAADKFEPHRGGTFIYFAADHVLKAIRAEFATRRGVIYRPQGVGKEIAQWNECEESLWGKLGRAPSPEEVGAALSWGAETVERVQRAKNQEILSLDAILVKSDGERRTFGEALADPRSTGKALQGYNILLRDLLAEVLKGLPEREREVVILRHGLGGRPPCTLQQAADILQRSRERVRQLESCGEARLVRAIALRFPQLLPDGVTPEQAVAFADRKDWGKANIEKKRKERVEAARQKTRGDIGTLATQGGEGVS